MFIQGVSTPGLLYFLVSSIAAVVVVVEVVVTVIIVRVLEVVVAVLIKSRFLEGTERILILSE